MIFLETNQLKIGIGAGSVFLIILGIFVVLVYKRMKRGKYRKRLFFLSMFYFPTFKIKLFFISVSFLLTFLLFFLIFIFILRYEPYATLHFDKTISIKRGENAKDVEKSDDTRPHTYANLNKDGDPIPGACRGIIPYQQPYVNLTSLNRPYYTKLQLFSSITLDWLRNAWGQVDELGKHAYDALCRGMERLLPYDKLEEIKDGSPQNYLGAIDENGYAEYDRFDNRTSVLMSKY